MHIVFQVLEIHLRTMHADKNGQMIVCKMCNVVFGTLVELESHACTSLDAPSSAGNLSTATSQNDLETAVTSVTPSSTRGLSLAGGMRIGFPCDYCTMEFMSMEKLHLHKEKNHKVIQVRKMWIYHSLSFSQHLCYVPYQRYFA